MTLKEFFKMYGNQIALGVATGGLMIMSAKVNKLEARCAKSFADVAADIAKLEQFKENNYDNFKILQKDINNLSTHVGYQGSLGVNS